MPMIAYYRRTDMPRDEALQTFKRLETEMGKVEGFGSELHKRIQDSTRGVAALRATDTVPFFDRVKVEVRNVSDALAVKDRYGFIRYAIGSYTNVEEFIAVRKKQGKGDWYV